VMKSSWPGSGRVASGILELWLAFGNIDLGWAEVEIGNVEQSRSNSAAHATCWASFWEAFS